MRMKVSSSRTAKKHVHQVIYPYCTTQMSKAGIVKALISPQSSCTCHPQIQIVEHNKKRKQQFNTTDQTRKENSYSHTISPQRDIQIMFLGTSQFHPLPLVCIWEISTALWRQITRFPKSRDHVMGVSEHAQGVGKVGR
jgi:hypothetical protein